MTTQFQSMVNILLTMKSNENTLASYILQKMIILLILQPLMLDASFLSLFFSPSWLNLTVMRKKSF